MVEMWGSSLEMWQESDKLSNFMSRQELEVIQTLSEDDCVWWLLAEFVSLHPVVWASP